MGLTSAMFTGLTGLNTNQFRIDTVGDNIANVNTTAFKGSRANFQNQFSLTLSGGSGPSANSGGTNPLQIGRGSMLGSVQRSFTPGSLETTGVPTDMAIEGEGFFVLQRPENDQVYSRDGTFRLDADNMLISSDGYRVMGYGVDDEFTVVLQGELTPLEIPLGTLSTTRATTDAAFDGNLNGNGTIATHGTILHSQAFEEGPGSPATEDTLLTELFDPDTPTEALFAEDDVITVEKAKKGDRQLPESTFTVQADSTLGDYMAFLQDALGLNLDEEAPGDAGVRLSDEDPPGEGILIIEGNAGENNALEIERAAIRSTNPNFSAPFSFTEQQAADGESVFTSYIAYDSLGTPINVDITMTLEEKTNLGTTWRFYAESRDDTDASPVLGTTGTVSFDTDGQVRDVTNNVIQVNRANTGALTPVQITLDFSKVTGLTSEESTMVMTTQDGYGMGTLTNFGVGPDGVLTGIFSNGLTRPLGQVALAVFTNPEGLVADVNNLFLVGPNSGQPIITTPETLGAGQVIGGALELSNVDLTREFIGLITASTGFSASGRVISTSNELLNELMLIAR